MTYDGAADSPEALTWCTARFGWEIGALNGHRQVQHGGSMPGFRSGFARLVDDQLTVIVLMNAEDVDRDAIVNGVAGLCLRSPSSAPSFH